MFARALLTVAVCLSLGGAVFADVPPTRPLPAPTPKPKVEVLVDQPTVKVVRISVAPGASLPEHTTPVDATVAALSGEGAVTIGDKRQPLPTHGVVFLPKEIPHAVFNTGKAPLVLVVHHIKGAR